jgi:diguanylate cyclase (GGDEF)-like protein/putative nucleotidyltransferase with HDIG domain
MGNDGAAWAALPARLRWLTAATVAAAAVRLAFGTTPAAELSTIAWFIGLLLISSISATFKVRLPLTGGGSTMSLSYAVDFIALLKVGPDLACVAAALSTWSQTTFRVRRRNPPHQVLFSMAAVVLATAAAGEAYKGLGGGLDAAPLAYALAVAGAAGAYFVVTTSLVALAVAWSRNASPIAVWHADFLWTAPGYVVGAAAAAAFVSALGHVSAIVLLLAVAVPALLTYRSYHVYFERLADEQRQVREVSDLHLATVEALAAAIDAKDNAFTQHVRRVERLAGRLAQELGMSESEIRGVKTAALLHDIGKLAVPEYILSKPGPLTAEEFVRVQAHPRVGAEIISNVPFPYPVVPLVRSHHERWDGTGYPDGLAGEAIPLGARIISVVDYYDALTCDRPYRRAVPEPVAIATLQDEAGRALDPRVVGAFIALMPALLAEGVPEAAPRAVGPGTGATAFPANRTLPPPKAGEPRHVFDDIARAHRELYVLYEIAQSMGRSLGVADTFTLVGSRLGALVPYSACALFLKVDGAGSVRCAEASGVDAALLRELVVPLGAGNVGWAVRERQPLLNGEAGLDFVIAESPATSRLRAVLVTPLQFNDECIGALAVYHVDLDAFKPDHQRFLERVGEQAAAVIYHSMLFERTREDSLSDLVTGLPNARFLKMHASTEIARARRGNRPLSLIVFDLDEFKQINDQYGHPTGDAALKNVAQLLAASLRPYDVCARYAGDEFVIVLSDCDAAEAESKRIELQLAADRGPVDLGVARVPLRLSAGCATFPTDGDDYQSLLARADHRMYQDKAGRRDRRPRGQVAPSRTASAPPLTSTGASPVPGSVGRDVA